MQVLDGFIIILIKMYHGKEDIQITEHKFELYTRLSWYHSWKEAFKVSNSYIFAA